MILFSIVFFDTRSADCYFNAQEAIRFLRDLFKSRGLWAGHTRHSVVILANLFTKRRFKSYMKITQLMLFFFQENSFWKEKIKIRIERYIIQYFFKNSSHNITFIKFQKLNNKWYEQSSFFLNSFNEKINLTFTWFLWVKKEKLNIFSYLYLFKSFHIS